MKHFKCLMMMISFDCVNDRVQLELFNIIVLIELFI